MRAQRDTVHPTSRRASPARRNSPALDSCEPTWRNASPGDITETTSPGVGRPRGWRHRLGEGVGHPGHGGAASRVAAPGLSAETTPPPGWGRSWRRRDRAATKRLPPGVGDLQADGAVGTTADGRTAWDDRPCHRQRLRRRRSAPGHPGRPPHAHGELRTMRTGRAGPAAAAARRRAARGRRPADRAESSAGCALSAGLARFSRRSRREGWRGPARGGAHGVTSPSCERLRECG